MGLKKDWGGGGGVYIQQVREKSSKGVSRNTKLSILTSELRRLQH